MMRPAVGHRAQIRAYDTLIFPTTREYFSSGSSAASCSAFYTAMHRGKIPPSMTRQWGNGGLTILQWNERLSKTRGYLDACTSSTKSCLSTRNSARTALTSYGPCFRKMKEIDQRAASLRAFRGSRGGLPTAIHCGGGQKGTVIVQMRRLTLRRQEEMERPQEDMERQPEETNLQSQVSI